MIVCLFVWSCARLLVCSLARLLVCSFARLIACLLARLFACLLSFALLAFFLACLLGSSKFVPWRPLDSSSRCSGARDSVLGGCLRAPRGVRELETRSLEAAGELLGVFGSSKFGPSSLLESSWRCSGAPHDRLVSTTRICVYKACVCACWCIYSWHASTAYPGRGRGSWCSCLCHYFGEISVKHIQSLILLAPAARHVARRMKALRTSSPEVHRSGWEEARR